MLDKYYVGLDITSFSDNGKYKPVSRVTLLLDDSKSITAGDDSGFELVANCPHATQTMANNLLAKLKGYQYQAAEAGDANLNPSAELGDGMTASRVYSTVSRVRDDGSGFLSVSSPGRSELEDEYPMDGPLTRMFSREIAGVRSSITKTADEIRLEVFGEDGYTGSSIVMQLDRIKTEVIGELKDESGKPISVASKIEQTAGNITSTVTEEYKKYTDGKIGDLGTNDLGQPHTVASKIEQKASSIKQTVFGYLDSDEQGNPVSVSSSIETALDGITLTASNNDANTISTIKLRYEGIDIDSAEINLTGLVTFKGLSEGTTSIDGACIQTGKIDAEYINVTEYIVFDPNEDPIEVKRNLQSWSEENSNPSYITSVGITSTAIYSPTIHAGTFFGNEFNVIAENAGNGSFNLYGKYNGQSVHAVSIGYSAGTAPYITLSGDGMIDFNFMAAYFNCNVDMGANDISFNVNGAISSLRELESRVTALEKKG